MIFFFYNALLLLAYTLFFLCVMVLLLCWSSHVPSESDSSENFLKMHHMLHESAQYLFSLQGHSHNLFY